MTCARAAAAPPRLEPLLRVRPRPLRIALVGNPNVGKSVLFGRLAGRYATVSNYPGTTVGLTRGRALVGAEVVDLVDTPGVNTFDGTLTEDETITRQLVRDGAADLVVQVADARNLRRALLLTSQLAELGRPMVLVLNMVDEARAHGIAVATPALARALGIPVVETVATEGRGVDGLRAALTSAAVPVVERGGEDHASWAHRTGAAGARHPLLGAAGDDHGHPRRDLVRRLPDALRHRARPARAGRLSRREGPAGRPNAFHHGTATAAGPPVPERADEDVAARAVVSGRSGAALSRGDGAALRPRPHRGAGAADRHRTPGGDEAARSPARDGAGLRHGFPEARLRGGGALRAGGDHQEVRDARHE